MCLVTIHHAKCCFGHAGEFVPREATSLFTILMGAGIALIVGQWEKDSPMCWFIFFFGVVAVVAIAGMGCILMAEAPAATGTPDAAIRRHAYDRASILTTRWFLLASLVIAILLPVLAICNELPGQAFDYKTVAELGPPQFYIFKGDKSAGVVVPVSLHQRMFRKGIPVQLNMEITLGEKLKDWYVEDVEGKVGVAESSATVMEPPPAPLEKDKQAPGTTSIWFLDGLKNDTTYTFRIYLHHRPGQPADPKTAISVVRERGGMGVTFNSRYRNR